MKYALVNPHWSFEGSTYFGCADPHFPLELLSAREFLRSSGHEVLLIDANIEGISAAETRDRLLDFNEDFLVIPTAPSYLFWRCPQPELRIPASWDRTAFTSVEGSRDWAPWLRHTFGNHGEDRCRHRASWRA